jgi:hypothetical protein
MGSPPFPRERSFPIDREIEGYISIADHVIIPGIAEHQRGSVHTLDPTSKSINIISSAPRAL